MPKFWERPPPFHMRVRNGVVSIDKSKEKNSVEIDAAWWAECEAMALMLFTGIEVTNKRGIPELKFLSDRTNPTQEDAIRALSLVLKVGRISPDLASALGGAFNARAAWPPVRAFLQKRSKGHSDALRDREIGKLVRRLRKRGVPYKDAIATVANQAALTELRVKEIYGKYKRYWAKRPGGIR